MSVLLITISTLANWAVITPTVDEATCLKIRPAVVKQYEARFSYNEYQALYIDSFCVSGKVVPPVNATDRALLVKISYGDDYGYAISTVKDKDACINKGMEITKQPNFIKWLTTILCWNGEVATP